MTSFTRELMIVGVLVVVVSLVVGTYVSQFDRSDNPRVGLPPEAGLDGPTATPAASLRIVTATVGASAQVTREVPAVATQPPAATATPVPPTVAPAIATQAPAIATQPPPQVVPASVSANFGGPWRIVDTVTAGAGAGQSFTFDVSLQQTGNRITGGNAGIQITGTVAGETATVTYSQPSLGHSGSFTWTLVNPARAEGTFTSSVPNSGTSTLQRLP